jgi:PAS domain-containing protein
LKPSSIHRGRAGGGQSIRDRSPYAGIDERLRLPTRGSTPTEWSSGFGAITDISERKKAEEKLIAATARFESVFNQSEFAGMMDLKATCGV